MSNKNLQPNADNQAAYLQTDSEARELILAAPKTAPQLPSYGGEEIPRAIVIVQQYSSTRQKSEGSHRYKLTKVQAKDESGKPMFENVLVEGKEGEENAVYEKRPVFTDKPILKQIRSKVGDPVTTNTLQVIPLRAKVSSSKMPEVLGANLNELYEAMTIGKVITIKRQVKDSNGKLEDKDYQLKVRAGIKKGAVCHLFYREGDKIFSTVTVNGGVKGSELLTDFNAAAKSLYQQLKAAKEGGTVKEIASNIVTALGLKAK
jgi:hypothetical protein